MLNVTQATKNSYLQDSGHKEFTISFPNLNPAITLTNSDLVEDTFELTERVNSGESIEFVGCLSSVLSFTTKTLKADVKGQYVTVSVKCNNTETIPLFHGYVDDVEQKPHQPDKIITAYDILYKLNDTDIAIWYNNLSFPITIKDFRDSLFTELNLTQVSTSLTTDNIQIVKQYNPAELKALDVIKSICQFNCVFGRINRGGNFEYMSVPNPTTVKQQIDYYKEATYQEYYVKPVDKLTIRNTGSDDIIYGGGENNYVIVDNFFARGLEDETLTSLAESLYTLVSGFNYQPFNADVNALPYMECLDVVSLPVQDLDTQVVSQLPYVILERTIKGIQVFRDNLVAEGDEYQHVFESDLSLQIEELKKQLEVIRGDMDNLKFAYYLFTNNQDISIADEETKTIVDVRFSAKEKSVVTFNCEILLTAETTVDDDDYYDAVGKITYYFNELEIGGYYPVETWQDGKHILNLYYYINIQDAGLKHFVAEMNMAGGSVLVKAGNLRGAIYGQNLVSQDEWTGLIPIEETVSAFDLEDISVAEASDSITVLTLYPEIISNTDYVTSFDLEDISVVNVTDSMNMVTHVDIFPMITEDGSILVTEDGYRFITEGEN